MSFAIGDVVQMKSGGPLMTIESLDGENATCSWMERTGPQNSPRYSKKQERFAVVTLTKSQRRAIGFSFR
jgi:uncharacterized protein YodC (DUF2158 family)